jgi:nucleoid-associated protein YgaU
MGITDGSGQENMKRRVAIVVGAAVVAVAAYALFDRGLLRLPMSPPETETENADTTAATQESAPAPAEPAVEEAPAPSFDIARIGPDGGTVIAGRAEPGSTVTVLSDNQEIGKVTANSAGEWVLVPEKPLQPGTHSLSLSAQTPGTEAAKVSAAEVVAVVPEPKPAEDGGTGEALVLLVPKQAGAPTTVLQAPSEAGAPATGAGPAVGAIEYDSEGKYFITGQAETGADLRVYLDDKFVGTAKSSDQGQFQFDSQVAPGEGEHRLRVDQVDGGGQVVARVEVPFTALVPTGLTEGERVVVVQRGYTLWHIALWNYGAGIRYFSVYDANRSQIADPDLIYPGQVFVVPAATEN